MRGCIKSVAREKMQRGEIHFLFPVKMIMGERNMITRIKILARACGVVTINDENGNMRNDTLAKGR